MKFLKKSVTRLEARTFGNCAPPNQFHINPLAYAAKSTTTLWLRTIVQVSANKPWLDIEADDETIPPDDTWAVDVNFAASWYIMAPGNMLFH